MKKIRWKKFVSFAIIILALIPVTKASAAQVSISRFSGENRYATAIEVAKNYLDDKQTDSIILASGKNYPDAISGALLAKQKGAPILLIEGDGTTKNDQMTLNYCYTKVNAGGTFYILGGNGAVSSKIDILLQNKGYKVIRFAGKDRYETSYLINSAISNPNKSKILVASGDNYLTSLVAASMSVRENAMFMIVPQNCGNEYVNILKKLNGIDTVEGIGMDSDFDGSDKYYGGKFNLLSGAVGDSVHTDIFTDVSSEHKPLGADEDIFNINAYSLNSKLSDGFSDNTANCIVVTGNDFPDALTSCTLIAKYNGYYLFSDNNDNKDTTDFATSAAEFEPFDYFVQNKALSDVKTKQGIIIGGTGAVSESDANYIDSVLTTGKSPVK